MSVKPVHLTALLDTLEQQGVAVDRSRFLLRDYKNMAAVPWYLQFFLAIASCIAFAFFFSLLAFLHFHEIAPSFRLTLGLLFITIAILIYRASDAEDKGKTHTITDVLAVQISFLLITSGKAIVFFHSYIYFDLNKPWQFCVLAVVMAALTFHLYRLPLERILSFLLVLISLLEFVVSVGGVFFNFLLIGLYLFAAVYLSFSARCLSYRYLRLSFVIAVFYYLNIYTTFYFLQRVLPTKIDGTQLFFWASHLSWLIAGLLIACAFYLNGKKRIDFAFGLLAVALAALSFFLPAGVFFAVLMMVVGHAKHEKISLTAGVLLLIFYLSQYYYQLNISLLNKSWLLMVSGVLLLLTAAVIAKMGWHKEVQQEMAR